MQLFKTLAYTAVALLNSALPTTANDVGECPSIAPRNFDCTTSIKCLAHYPSETNNYDPPAQRRSINSGLNSMPANFSLDILDSPHDVSAILNLFEATHGTESGLVVERGVFLAPRHERQPTNDQPVDEQQCCRPTWDCFDFWSTVRMEQDPWTAKLIVAEHEDFRKFMCCMYDYWQPKPQCPDGALREMPFWTEMPPKCTPRVKSEPVVSDADSTAS